MLIFLNNTISYLQRALASPPTLGALLFLCATLSSEPAHAFGKKPVVVPPPSTPTEPSAPRDVIRARWETKARDGVAWSVHVYDALPALAPHLLSSAPADVADFCPGYAELSSSDRKNFWVYLLSSVAQLESDFDPTSIYTENFRDAKGNLVQSVGLLQLSLGDAAPYGCSFRTTADIEDPIQNLDCGMRILNKLVGQNHRLAGKSGSAWQGGARYWSTLRSPKVSTIQGWTRALPMCGS
jgi:hypothetical protein